MAKIKIPGCIVRENKDGTMLALRRVVTRVNGKQKAEYISIGDPRCPGFHARLDKVNKDLSKGVGTPERRAPDAGTISALILDFRKTLADRPGKKGPKLTQSSIGHWNMYLKQIDAEHGHKLVAELRASHLYEIRDNMAWTPGRANSYMSCFRTLLKHACKRDWIATNPALGMEDKPKLREHQPWPPHVIAEVMEATKRDHALRLAIVTALCSGQRIGDIIRMRPTWVREGMMEFRSQKTDTMTFIPMHETWTQEIVKNREAAAARNILPMTLVHLTNGQPYPVANELQKRLRAIMVRLGHVRRDEEGRPLDAQGNLVVAGTYPKTLYTFHGLCKNAICYLTEMGEEVETISAIVGKTPEMVRFYAKEARKWMLAKAAAERIVAGRFDRLVAGQDTANG